MPEIKTVQVVMFIYIFILFHFLVAEFECRERLKDGYFYDSVTSICAKVVKSPTRVYNQSEAAAFCERDGAKLISIKSEAEQYFLLSWIYTRSRMHTYIHNE